MSEQLYNKTSEEEHALYEHEPFPKYYVQIRGITCFLSFAELRSRKEDIDKTFKILELVLEEDFSMRDTTSYESVVLQQELSIVSDEPIKDRAEKYLMVVAGERSFQSLDQAGTTYDCDWIPVRIGDLVLLADLSTRPMTDHDRLAIRDAADEYRGSK